MRIRTWAQPIAALCTLAACAPERPSEPTSVAFTHVTVIDGTGAPPHETMTVVVSGDRIRTIAPTPDAAIPEGARVVEAAGKFLIPGLWDMHVHMVEEGTTLPLYLANGVTGVRDMGGVMDSTLLFRDEINRGDRTGPRIVTAGLFVDGPKDAPSRFVVESAEEARRAADSLAARGVDFIKVHNALPREAFLALIERAREHGLHVAGHVPLTGITVEEAVSAGQRSIEHVTALLESVLPRESARSIEAARAALANFYNVDAEPIFTHMIRHGVWFTPTLVAGRGAALAVDPAYRRDADPRMKYIAPAFHTFWDRHLRQPHDLPATIVEGRKWVFRQTIEIAREAHEWGVNLLVGTDVGGISIFPGFSVHEELELLAEAGLSPAEALQAATLNPARYLGAADSLGTVTVGKLADLVLLNADPLADIRNTQTISAVMVRGRLFARPQLDSLLTDVEAKVRRIS